MLPSLQFDLDEAFYVLLLTAPKHYQSDSLYMLNLFLLFTSPPFDLSTSNQNCSPCLDIDG